MPLQERLSNLSSLPSGQSPLKAHTPTIAEIRQHIEKADNLLTDAKRKANSLDGRFNNAYSAVHSFLMASLKMHGYRTSTEKGHRAVLFELIDGLVPAASATQEMLIRISNMRNRSEYDSTDVPVTNALVEGLIDAVANVQEEVGIQFKKFLRMAE